MCCSASVASDVNCAPAPNIELAYTCSNDSRLIENTQHVICHLHSERIWQTGARLVTCTHMHVSQLLQIELGIAKVHTHFVVWQNGL